MCKTQVEFAYGGAAYRHLTFTLEFFFRALSRLSQRTRQGQLSRTDSVCRNRSAV